MRASGRSARWRMSHGQGHRQSSAKHLGAMDRNDAALRDRVAALEKELAEIKGEMKTRAVLAEMLERLDQLEAAPRSGLRAV